MRENPRFREIYAEWSLIFECVSFLEACFLIPGVLKLTDRARCIKLQRCLFFPGAECPKGSSTQLPSSEKDTEPSDCSMVL